MGRNKEVLRLEFRTMKYEITRKDIDAGIFEIIENRRLISKGTVKGILDLLLKDKHFNSSFVVNKVGNKYRLIDGNHRYEAIVKLLSAFPNKKVEVHMHIFDDLSIEEERRMYSLYNKGKKQSTNDFVQQYKSEILIYKLIMNNLNFPVKMSVYGTPISISFFRLIGPYLASQKPRFPGGYTAKPLDFIEESKKLGQKDVTLLNAFLKDYLEAFGPFKNNKWFKGTPLTAIMKIWMDNREEVNSVKMVKAFKTKLAQDYMATDLISNSGMSACIYARDKFISLLNAGNGGTFKNKDIIGE